MQKQTLSNYFLGFLLVICSYYLYNSLKLPFGKMSNPGSGFLPTLLGISSLVICLALLISNLLNKNKEKLEDFKQSSVFKLLLFIVGIALFAATFKLIGIIMLFPLTLLVSKVSGFQGWLYPLLFSGVVTLINYVVFKWVLGVPVPTGVLF